MNEAEKHKAVRDAVQTSARSRRLVPSHSLIGKYASALLYRGRSQVSKTDAATHEDAVDGTTGK